MTAKEELWAAPAELRLSDKKSLREVKGPLHSAAVADEALSKMSPRRPDGLINLRLDLRVLDIWFHDVSDDGPCLMIGGDKEKSMGVPYDDELATYVGLRLGDGGERRRLFARHLSLSGGG